MQCCDVEWLCYKRFQGGVWPEERGTTKVRFSLVGEFGRLYGYYNHWQNCWSDGTFRGAPLPHFNVVRRKGKTWPTFEQTFTAAILNVKSTLNGGKGGCWIFFLNWNVKQGVVRCAFQLLWSLIVDSCADTLSSSPNERGGGIVAWRAQSVCAGGYMDPWSCSSTKMLLLLPCLRESAQIGDPVKDWPNYHPIQDNNDHNVNSFIPFFLQHQSYRKL